MAPCSEQPGGHAESTGVCRCILGKVQSGRVLFGKCQTIWQTGFLQSYPSQGTFGGLEVVLLQMCEHEESIRVLPVCLRHACTQQQAAGGHLPAADQGRDGGYCREESKRIESCKPSCNGELHANI